VEEPEKEQIGAPGQEAKEPGSEETAAAQSEEEGAEPSREDEGVEIYEYDPSGKGYKSDQAPESPEMKRYEPQGDVESADTYGVRPREGSGDIPEAPIRPIGKTIVGIALTAEGGIGTGLGVFMMILIGSAGGPPTMGLPYLGLGLGMLIPGAALLTSAREEWNIYNEWERTYQAHSRAPAVGLQYTFDF